MSENSAEIDGYPTTKYVELEFSYMLLKQEPDALVGTIVVETDCGIFKVAGKASEETGVSYELFFNYGIKSSTGSDTPVLSTILEKAQKMTTEADIALYGGTGSAPFTKTLSAKTEDAAKAEYNKLVESAKTKGTEIIAELNKIVSENSAEIDGYPTTKYVELEFSYMLLKQEPDALVGTIVVETDCGIFKVAGKFMPGRIISVL